jgi:hypothetical protein
LSEKAIQLFRADFIPEIAAVSPPLELRATFLGRGSSAQDAATLSDQGWAEMLGNVAQIIIVVLQTPSSPGGSWASYGKQIGMSLHTWFRFRVLIHSLLA